MKNPLKVFEENRKLQMDNGLLSDSVVFYQDLYRTAINSADELREENLALQQKLSRAREALQRVRDRTSARLQRSMLSVEDIVDSALERMEGSG